MLQKCGTLVNATQAYTLRRSGATTQIVLANEPAPIVLTLRPDNSVALSQANAGRVQSRAG